jgi:hypothetical protein
MARFSGVRKGVWTLLFVMTALVGVHLLAQAPAPAAPPRVDIAGEWAVARNEDQPDRAPGPELGDYTGLPINRGAAQKAQAWDASLLSQPERQNQAHPVQYHMHGPAPNLRILKIIDPVTQVHVAYTLAGFFGRADRVIWVDGRNHPSQYSEHTWDGFSTGTWDENGHFVVTTTHPKHGVIRRNGTPSSAYAKVTQRFFRHGLYLVSFFLVEDPIYLEEPLGRTTQWVWDPGGNMTVGTPFEAVDELGARPLGWVPHWPLGVLQKEFAEVHNIPFEATQGGKETIYPEYQLKLAELYKQEAAEKAKKAAEEAAAAAKRPARR